MGAMSHDNDGGLADVGLLDHFPAFVGLPIHLEAVDRGLGGRCWRRLKDESFPNAGFSLKTRD